MIKEYLRKRSAFHDVEPVKDKDGVKYYFLGLKTEAPDRAAKELDVKRGVMKSIHYKDVDHEQLMAYGILDRKYATKRLKEKPRVAAIHLSHSMALLDFIESRDGAKWAFIFEEDILLPKGGKKAMKYAKQYLKDAEAAIPMSDPQLHYIGHCYTGKGGERVKGDVMKKTSGEDRPRCRHAYVVNRAGAKKLLASSWPMDNNGDEMWANLDFVYFSDNDGYFTQDWLMSEESAKGEALRSRPEKPEKAEKMKAERMTTKDDKPSPYIPLIVIGSVLICGAILLWIDKRRRNRDKIEVVAVLE